MRAFHKWGVGVTVAGEENFVSAVAGDPSSGESWVAAVAAFSPLGAWDRGRSG